MKNIRNVRRDVGNYLDETRPKRQRTTGYFAFFVIMMFVAYVFGRNDASSDKSVAMAFSNLTVNETQCKLPSIYPASNYQVNWDKVLNFCDSITEIANKYGISPKLIASIIMMESGGDSGAISTSGAVGLMQVMPNDGLSAYLYGSYFSDRPTTAELLDPTYNIEWGTSHLSSLINTYGGVKEALYHYGPVDVGYDYADKILSLYNSIED